MTIDENYTERLVNSVAKTLVEALENLTIADVNMYRLGYTRAIDDFAEKLSEVCHEESFEVHLSPGHFTAGIKAEVLTLDGVAEIIWDVAEQLKEGAVDG